MYSFKLFNDDCLKQIKNIKNKSIDLILTDPPYNIAKYSTGNIKLPNRSDINNDIAFWDLIEINPADFLTEFKRILKPTGNIFIFTSYNLLGKWHEVFDKEFDTFQYFIWHKTNPVPKIYKNGFLNSCELIICLWNKGHIWNFTKQNEMHNFFESPICMRPERLQSPKHPAQKPIKLLQHLIKISTNENAIVYDPFMGVGSTAVASLKLNRKFIGCEIDKIYFDAAIKRINMEVIETMINKINRIITEEIDLFIKKMETKEFNKNNFIMNPIDGNFKFYSSLARSFDSSLGNTFQKIAGKIATVVYGESNVILPSKGADLVILYNNTYYIVEIKLGGNLDSKKLPSEFNALEQFYNKNTSTFLPNKNISFCLGTVYAETEVVTKLFNYFNNNYSRPSYYLLLEKDFWNFICNDIKGFEIVKQAYDANVYKINKFLEKIK